MGASEIEEAGAVAAEECGTAIALAVGRDSEREPPLEGSISGAAIGWAIRGGADATGGAGAVQLVGVRAADSAADNVSDRAASAANIL